MRPTRANSGNITTCCLAGRKAKTKFEPCLKNDETLARVQADTSEGQQYGVTGTPTFFVNGKPLVGAQPITAFQAAIDQGGK